MKPIPSLSTEATAAEASFEHAVDDSAEPSSQSLRSLLDLCAWLECRQAAEIALAIAEQLDEAERMGASPLGLRPERILISDANPPSILIVDPKDKPSARVIAHYLSPEEARGEATDSRSDLYALGVVLYEMLTDRVPFDGRDADAVKQRHLHRPPEPPIIFRTDAPEALSELVMRLLEKDPVCRPQHAADLFADLRDVIETEFAATRRAAAITQRNAEILASHEAALPLRGNAAAIDREAEPVLEDGESVLDIEFNDLFSIGLDAIDEVMPTFPADDPLFATPITSHNASSSSNLNEVESAYPTDESAHTANSRAASIAVETARDSLAERDPFDLPAASPHVSLPAALPLEGTPERKPINDKRAPADAGDARLRWVALVLLCIIAVAALLLYKVIMPAATRSDDTFTPLHTSPAVEPASPVTDHPAATMTQPDASVSDVRPSPNGSTTGSVSVRSIRTQAGASQWKRKAKSGHKAHSGKRKKRSRAHQDSYYRLPLR